MESSEVYKESQMPMKIMLFGHQSEKASIEIEWIESPHKAIRFFLQDDIYIDLNVILHRAKQNKFSKKFTSAGHWTWHSMVWEYNTQSPRVSGSIPTGGNFFRLINWIN